jgi:HNH endonuclease
VIRHWSIEDENRLRDLYLTHTQRQIAALLDRTPRAVNQKAKILRLSKPGGGRFPKGHISANAGTRRPGWAPGRMASTQFKKGGRSSNYLPIGTFRFDSDGYPRRKIADGIGGFGNPKVWEFVHRRVWQEANGPIPRGHRVWWKDGDKSNNAIGNLELLSGAEHMARTTLHNFPEPLKKVIMLKGALKRRIRRMEDDGKKHDGRSAGSPVCDDRSLAG